MKIELTEEQVLELLESEGLEEISESAGKHDCHTTTYVAPIDGKFYRFCVSFSYNDGVQIYGTTTAIEVEKKEKVVTTWDPV